MKRSLRHPAVPDLGIGSLARGLSLSLAAILAVSETGCWGRKQTVPVPPAPAPVQSAPAPTQTNPAAQPPTQGTTPPATVPRTAQPATPAPVPNPSMRLGDILSPEQQRQYNVAIDRSLASAQNSLGSVAKRMLSRDQQAVVAQVQQFIQQAQQTRKSDLGAAKSLAERADVLARDLARSVRR